MLKKVKSSRVFAVILAICMICTAMITGPVSVSAAADLTVMAADVNFESGLSGLSGSKFTTQTGAIYDTETVEHGNVIKLGVTGTATSGDGFLASTELKDYVLSFDFYADQTDAGCWIMQGDAGVLIVNQNGKLRYRNAWAAPSASATGGDYTAKKWHTIDIIVKATESGDAAVGACYLDGTKIGETTLNLKAFASTSFIAQNYSGVDLASSSPFIMLDNFRITYLNENSFYANMTVGENAVKLNFTESYISDKNISADDFALYEVGTVNKKMNIKSVDVYGKNVVIVPDAKLSEETTYEVTLPSLTSVTGNTLAETKVSGKMTSAITEVNFEKAVESDGKTIIADGAGKFVLNGSDASIVDTGDSYYGKAFNVPARTPEAHAGYFYPSSGSETKYIFSYDFYAKQKDVQYRVAVNNYAMATYDNAQTLSFRAAPAWNNAQAAMHTDYSKNIWHRVDIIADGDRGVMQYFFDGELVKDTNGTDWASLNDKVRTLDPSTGSTPIYYGYGVSTENTENAGIMFDNFRVTNANGVSYHATGSYKSGETSNEITIEFSKTPVKFDVDKIKVVDENGENINATAERKGSAVVLTTQAEAKEYVVTLPVGVAAVDGSTLAVNEVRVLGNSLKVYDTALRANGEILAFDGLRKLEDGTDIVFEPTIENNKTEDTNLMAIICGIDASGMLCAVDTQQATVSSETGDQPINVSIKASKNIDVVKAFLWNTDIKPIADMVVLERNVPIPPTSIWDHSYRVDPYMGWTAGVTIDESGALKMYRDTSASMQAAYFILDERVSEGKLAVSYDILSNTAELGGNVYVFAGTDKNCRAVADATHYESHIWMNNYLELFDNQEWALTGKKMNTAANTWYHFDVWYDFDARTVSYYVDGALIGTEDMAEGFTHMEQILFAMGSKGNYQLIKDFKVLQFTGSNYDMSEFTHIEGYPETLEKGTASVAFAINETGNAFFTSKKA